MPSATLVSIQVGEPRSYTTPPRFSKRPAPWSSSFIKHAIEGPVRLGAENLDGDRQADLSAHGGRDKAVNVYPAEHYPHWIAEGAVAEFIPGTFGENFTVRGLLESELCIGDRFRIGEAAVEVSQPRQPCWKLAHFLRQADMVKRVIAAGRTGWYFRVLEAGAVCAGDAIALLDRPFPRWTLAEANRLMHRDPNDLAAVEALASCPALSQSWVNSFNRRLAAGR